MQAGDFMNLNSKWTVAMLVALAVSTAGCAKKNEEADANAAAGAEIAETSAPAKAAPVKSKADTAANDEKAAAIQAALAEDAIVSDPRGQWASSALASSTYASDKAPTAKTSYSANAATGAPNVERYGDNGNAWTTETPDKGIEWLEVKFDKPVSATEIRIRQSYGPGAIIKVDLLSEDGARHMVWQGLDDQQYPPSTIAWFNRQFQKTSYPVTGARITLATNAVSGWNEIDAVQLLGD
jgi:hypothetical protein